MRLRAELRLLWSALALPVLAVALGLSACGGGQSKPAPRAEEPAAFNWTHEAVRVQGAHEQVRDRHGADVLPGEGVSVAIIDTGIDLGHWAFDRERVTEVNLDREDATESGFVLSHGTSVASVIAAQPGAAPREFEDIGVRGVAPGARLTVFAVADRWPEEPTPEEELGWFGAALSPEAGVDILNISFGNKYDLISDYPDEAAVRGRYGRLMDLLAQGGKEEPSLIVFAAGNDNGPCDAALVGAFGDPARCVADPDISEFYGTPTGLFFADSPGVDAALQVHGEALRGHVVSVVASRRDRELASFSNRCGIAAPWCIAAPGVDVPVAYYGPEDPADPYASGFGSPHRGQERFPGTSFAAPLVAGGLAVMKHRFRGQLGNSALLQRLYATADKQGPASPDAVPELGVCPPHLDLDGDLSACELSSTHGQGIIDLDAATQPVGDVRVARGSRLAQGSVSFYGSGLGASAAVGDALARGLADQEIALFDTLDAPFWLGLGSLVRPPSRPSLAGRLDALLGLATETVDTGAGRVTHAPGGAAALLDTPLGFTRFRLGLHRASGAHEWTGGHASLAAADTGRTSLSIGEEPLQISLFTTAHAPGGRGEALPYTGAVAGWRHGRIGLRVGVVNEPRSALRLQARGAFGGFSSSLAYAGIGGATRLGAWTVSADAEAGIADVDSERGLIAEVSPLATSAFGISAARTFDAGGQRLSFSVSQPLRVEQGHARLDMPTGRTPDGGVTRQVVAVPLSPSKRQVDMTADVRQRLRGGTELRLRSTVSFHPGHRAGEEPEFSLLAALLRRF
ncbi:MAG: S8 family serine peptidase [Acidobacteriota bacterium]|nr:S8 family serine peptidase [Acidobacteriota bacterium]